jgi:hypothetical protein
MPRPAPREANERIAPLLKPAHAARRDWRSRMSVLCDGAVIADERDLAARRPVANAFEAGVAGAWTLLMDARERALAQRGPGADELWTGQ